MSRIIPTEDWIYSDWCCACGTNQGIVRTYYFQGTDYWSDDEVVTDIMLCENCAKRINKKTICERFFFNPNKIMYVAYRDNNNEMKILWRGIPCSV